MSPAGRVAASDLAGAIAQLKTWGFQVRLAPHALDTYGYLAGRDRDRADDLTRAFTDPTVQGILCTRGGWGCNRILPLLDYAAIAVNPKPLIGYSDITALLLALHRHTGLVGIHGPVATSSWTDFSNQSFRAVLMEGRAARFENPPDLPVQTLRGGRARGPLLGGNLSTLVSLIGSDYLPAWDGAILFLEEVGEDWYRVDRLLSQLALGGILGRLGGVIFAQCTRCGPAKACEGEAVAAPEPSLTLNDLLETYFLPLNVPVWFGSAIGHIADKFSLPLGVTVEMDGDRGTLQLLEPATVD
ncbi:MAG: LD-carboxypeptidase [Cyanophyceae cyanobacterium]